MKTAITIPDDVARSAESLAKQMHIPRSRLYIKAIREFVRKHRDEAITKSYDDVYSKIQESKEDIAFRRRAAHLMAKRVEWE